MSGYGSHAPAHGAHPKTPLSVPWIVAAAVLIGIGLTVMSYFLTYITTTADWTLIPGSVLLAVGFWMLMNRRAGLDSGS
ncbi:MAG: hypothetical protein ACYCPN_07030 [Thermoplasmata archaeon]